MNEEINQPTQPQEPSQPPTMPSPEPPQYTPYPQMPDPRKKALIIFGIIVLISLVGVGGWFFYKSRSKPKVEEVKKEPTVEEELSGAASDLEKDLSQIEADFKELDKIDSTKDNVPSF